MEGASFRVTVLHVLLLSMYLLKISKEDPHKMRATFCLLLDTKFLLLSAHHLLLTSSYALIAS